MKKQQGFTLIELMIVVAVIGVLSAIAIPKYQEYVKKGALGAALASVSALKTNVEDSIASTGSFPSATSSAFNLGTITLTPDEDESGAAGTITADIDDGAATGLSVVLTRTTEDEWSCKFKNGDADYTTIKITGCNQ
ncbi:pilin [Photobacterium phosphoreum]|uniref:pilin n=1 Tax=Photobacterium phosphoreum TaxID=659 RepID=UPI0022B7CEFC|nr:pilin [Photobacterium phosphoreum]MCD9511366.1 prepilin-type N-terminal cleavage/methylation domain-containing protein [Photobacterium phosphoreum]